jgi:subtilase family serine protease
MENLMLAKLHRTSLAASLALMLAGTVSAAGAKPNIDMGLSTSSQPTRVTLVLKLHNQDDLEAYIQQTVTPGSPHFQQFLSTADFAKRYGATDKEIARVQAYLAKQGLTGTVMANRLGIQVSGTLGQFSSAFKAPIHTYTSRSNGASFHRPATPLVIPAELADTVVSANGLNSEKKYLSHRLGTPKQAARQQRLSTLATFNSASKSAGSSNPTATGEPGAYTVGDVADLYNINPLYQRGVTGKGSTVAIVTLSNFDPADAQSYWDTIGLTTKSNRITQVHVDGGGAIDDGSGETALDVEQAGGLAPFADVIVYDAPNAGNGFIDAFAQAVADNKADSISTSWGSPEIYNFAALNVDGASPTDTTDVGDLVAFHQVLMEAAAQGQSVFAASGDSGAYDTVRGLGYGTGPGDFSAPLTVDSPASDPYITAAGGTTVPFTYAFRVGNTTGPQAAITQESVWGWDYIQNYFDSNFGPGLLDLFSVGGGGGVSVYWRTPFYQRFTRGVKTSEAKQSLVYNDPDTGPTTYLKLPNHFPGRNVPDIALNADPETGYIVVSSVDGGLVEGEGGTSFVAPQLNGISALLRQSSGRRIGLWNPRIYLLQNIFGYGRYSGFHSVNAGDNWFYQGAPHYTPGAGIGTLDVTNLDQLLKLGLRY